MESYYVSDERRLTNWNTIHNNDGEIVAFAKPYMAIKIVDALNEKAAGEQDET